MPTPIAFHPLADLFPLMEGPEFDALAADIKTHGQQEAIVLLDDQILDGRNRYRACEAAGVEPIYQDWDNHGDPRAFVVSKNLHRRHLNESQRAMIAARLMTTKAGNNQKTVEDMCVTTRAQAAELLNVSPASVTNAGTVLRGGTAEEKEAVMQGRASVRNLAEQIRDGAPPKERKSGIGDTMSQVGKNPERIQRQQIEAEIWQRMGDALIHLSALPLPTDVAAIVRKSANRTRAVELRLSKASQWLKEFSNAWHGQ